ncbi:ATP-binding protein [Baekduia sp. Peel2402]|uniref:ATP-binding protein n=1 Tax=Baekduia sp. Peel2402 TaxID=3458296 RepID=UPI00403ECED9
MAWLRALETPDPPLGDVALVVSEAVTNVVNHAYIGRDPGEVRVELSLDGSELALVVADDGTGLRPRPDSPGLGYGLALMVAVSKRFEAQTVEGTGTRLCAWFSRDAADATLPEA